MKSVVFLDLDETLVAQEQAFSRAYEAVAKLAGVAESDLSAVVDRVLLETPCADVVRRCCFGGRDVLWAEPGEGSVAEREIGECAERYRREVWTTVASDPTLAARLSELFTSTMRESTAVFADVLPVVDRLAARTRLAVVTNGMLAAQQAKLEHVGLAPYFERLFASTEVGRGKPSREIFDYAVQTMSADPGDCVMVGDSLAGDVEGALRAGLDAVWVNRGAPPSSRADVTSIADLSELEEAL